MNDEFETFKNTGQRFSVIKPGISLASLSDYLQC